jgi:CO dehydrogenase maturation factor
MREHLGGPPRRVVPLDPGGASAAWPSAATSDGVRLLATEEVGLLLDHLADGMGEYVVVDLPADASASARFDLTVLVSEPTRRTVELFRQHAARAVGQRAALGVLGNRISDWGAAAWLTEQVGDTLLGCVGHSAWIRAAERGTAGPVGGLEPGNTLALAAVLTALDARRPPLDMQQGDIAATQSEQCHPAVVGAAYSASRR